MFYCSHLQLLGFPSLSILVTRKPYLVRCTFFFGIARNFHNAIFLCLQLPGHFVERPEKTHKLWQEGFMDFQGTIYNMYPWKKGIFTIIYLRDWLIFNGKISRKFIPVPCVLWCQMLPTNYHKLPTFNPKFAKATGSRQSGLTQQRQSLDFWSRCRATGSGVVIWSRVLFIRRYGWNDWKQLNQYLIYNYKTIYIYWIEINMYTHNYI